MDNGRGERLDTLRELAGRLSAQVDNLRTMHVKPGDVEPVDQTGADLCGRVRQLTHLCRLLDEELSRIGAQIEKDRM